MAVDIIWSLTQGGDAVSLVDHGNSSNGSNTTEKEIYLRHNGSNPITNAVLYLQSYTGTYNGEATPTSDINEVLGWGNTITANGFGGMLIHQGASDSYAEAWPTYLSRTGTAVNTFYPGNGDSAANGFPILTSTGASVEGQIENGTPNVRFKLRVQVPVDESVLGIRQVDQVLQFDFTS